MRAFARQSLEGSTEERFEDLALDLARFQAREIRGYGRLLAAHGSRLESIEDIVPVPVEAFRFARVAAHGADSDAARFVTSGTTAGAPGVHCMRTTATYRALCLSGGRRALIPEGLGRRVVVALAPAPADLPTSSLGFMMRAFMEEWDGRPLGGRDTFDPGAADRWLLSARGVDVGGLAAAARVALERGEPLLVLATGFALVALFDALGDGRIEAPASTVVMPTGGFKGRSRQMAPAELVSKAARAFGIDQSRVVGEYGMTELSSQLYEGTLPGAPLSASRGVYLPPPWLRVVPRDPVTLHPVLPGAVGLASFIDLGNVDSAVSVLTEDLVRERDGGIELLGRRPGAPLRGCSLAVEELLGAFERRPESRAVAATLRPRSVAARGRHDPGARRRVERLVEAARRIADSADPLGADARRRLPGSTGLSAEGIELALQRCLETHPTDADIDALCASVASTPRAHVVLPANVFTAVHRAIALGLASSERVVVRPSRREPVMARLLAEASGDLFELSETLAVEPGDSVFVFGSDDTVEAIRGSLPLGARLNAFGSGIGVAVVEPGAIDTPMDDCARALAEDVVLFDQRGCLSPRVALVLGDDAATRRFAVALAGALTALETTVPRGRLSQDEEADAGRYRETLRFVGESLPAGRGWIGLGRDGGVIVPPAGRNLHVARVDAPADALEAIAPLVTAIGVEASDATRATLAERFPRLRLCRFGRMQRPPIDGPVDRRKGCAV